MILKHAKIEYIQTHRKYLKRTERTDENDVQIPGSGKKTKGIKKGVMVAGLNEDEQLIIGFSMCHKFDLFDHVGGAWINMNDDQGNHMKTVYMGGRKIKNFGLDLAFKRASMWRDRENVQIVGRGTIKPDHPLSNTVYIPASMEKKFNTFVGRCISYYKDKTIPAWICQVEYDLPKKVA
jgi:hypothetical protein